MNSLSKSLTNTIPSIISPIKRNSFKLNFLETRNFLTVNKLIKNNSNFLALYLKNKSINQLKHLSKSHYCEKIGNVVMLNSKNEIKIAFEEKTFSVFFNETDSINIVNEKILGINEKIQAVEFINMETKEVLSEEIKNNTLMNSFNKNPFLIRINKHISLTYIPGVFSQLFGESEILSKLQNNPDYLKSAEHIKNVILLYLYDLKEKNSANIKTYEQKKALFLSEITSKLDQREKLFQFLFEKQTLSEKW